MRRLTVRQGSRTRDTAQGAHNRETLQTTGCDEVRIVIVPGGFAPLPHVPGRQWIPMAIRMRFPGMAESIGPMWLRRTNPGAGTEAPPAGRPRARVKERAGRNTLFSSSAMSSGRLFLDQGARQQSPSPLHRHGQHILIAGRGRTDYHRTVASVLTGCLTSGDKRSSSRAFVTTNSNALLSATNATAVT